MTRYVSRALRAWSGPPAALAPATGQGAKSSLKSVGSKLQGLLHLRKRPKEGDAGPAATAAAEVPGVWLRVDRDRAGNLHLVAQTQAATR